jgi:hypothetical protein
MGFPLIMYLSRSKTVSLWPQLEQPKASTQSFQGLKSDVTLSLNPKVNISAEWKRHESDPPFRNKDTPWPPWESEPIVQAIEHLLREQHQIGGIDDLLAGNFGFLAYKLCGFFKLDRIRPDFEIAGLDLKVHGLTGRLHLPAFPHQVALTLALENIAGIDERDGRWDVWESGAMHFLSEAKRDGYPLIGLFTCEGRHPTCLASCGAIYFASYSEYQSYMTYRAEHEARDTIGRSEPDIFQTLGQGCPTISKLRTDGGNS